MLCVGKATFYALRSNVSKKDGKTYHTVDLNDGEKLISLSCRCPESLIGVTPTTEIKIACDIFTYKGMTVCNVVEVLDIG